MKAPYRACIIGLGRIGYSLQFDRKREQPASHSAALAADKNFRLAGGYDSDIAKMAAWSRRYPGAKIYDNLGEMLADGRWDLIVVAVDEVSHLPVTQAAAKAGPGLIVLEKPVAPSVREAEMIRKSCNLAGVPVVVNHERRFSRDYRQVAELITAGRLGRIRTVHGSIYSPNFGWRKNDHTGGKGTLLHDGTHIIDIIRFLTRQELTVEAAAGYGDKFGGNIGGIGATGRIGKDIFLTLDFGFQTRQFGFEVEMNFEKGRVRIGNGVLEVSEARPSPLYEGFFSLKADRSYGTDKTGRTGYFSGMVRHCAEVLDGKTSPASSLDDGIEAMRIAEKIAKLSGCL